MPVDTDRRARRAGLLAILCVALAWALVMQAAGWAQSSNYALVRALSHGTAKIDHYQWETKDKSYVRGHFYSVKAPGLAFLVLPLYEALDAAGARSLAHDAAHNADVHGAGRWVQGGPPRGNYGGSHARAVRVRTEVADGTPMIWALGLLGAVVPALVLLLLVRALAERIEPGYGTAAALTLGLATLVMPFATLFFSHVLAATLAFAAFALLWREREGAPRHALVVVAGLLAGLAVSTEYPLAIAGAAVGLYAIARGDVVRRGVAYAAGVVAGVIPLALYNLWAFGALTHFSYDDAVAVQGSSGHAALGLNDGGFFGIGAPSVPVAAKLLFSGRGLVTLCPVVALGAVGTVLLYRRGRRAEALTIGGIALAYLVYNSGYWLPFGGGAPGPRFLIPALPFLAVPIAHAYKRFPATTLALALPSALLMLAATTALPLIGNGDIGIWGHLLKVGIFEHTVVSVLGGDNSWPAVLPVLAAAAAAVAFARAATVRLDLARDARLAFAVLGAWAALAVLLPRVLVEAPDAGPTAGAAAVIAGVTLLAAAALAVSLAAQRRPLRKATPARSLAPRLERVKGSPRTRAPHPEPRS